MDSQSSRIMRAVWAHSGIKGYVFTPHITGIGTDHERFHPGIALDVSTASPTVDSESDWYWTPAVSGGTDRKKQSFTAQRVLWVDCDEGYDRAALRRLAPSMVWETSPGHRQAVWLMDDYIDPMEYSADGIMGLLASVAKADKSGVDIGQLLRVPGSWHHKSGEYQGRIIRASKATHSISDVLRRAGLALGLRPDVAVYLATPSPYGDRSRQLWRFASALSDAGVSELDAYRLLRLSKWNKWGRDADKLKADIHRAYEANAGTKSGHTEHDASPIESTESGGDVGVEPWDMQGLASIGWLAYQPPKWLIPGMIPEGGCGLLVAAPKVGKTRSAIEGALGCATGVRPFGLPISGATPVGFFSLEDGEHLFARRMGGALDSDESRLRYHWAGHVTEGLVWSPSKSMPLVLSFSPMDLSEGADKQRLYATIKSYGLGLVIIDTLSMAVGKHDVNNSRDMYEILKDIKAVAKATNCAVLFIHHTRKRVFEKGESLQEKVLGSTALHAWCDFLLSLSRDEASGLLRLWAQTKMGSEDYWLDDRLKVCAGATEV